jgi:hypothetical protein
VKPKDVSIGKLIKSLEEELDKKSKALANLNPA